MLACCTLSLSPSLLHPKHREDAILCKEQYFCNLCAIEASGIAAKCNQMERKSTLLSRARRFARCSATRNSEPKKTNNKNDNDESWQCSRVSDKTANIGIQIKQPEIGCRRRSKDGKYFSLCSNYEKFLVMLRKVAQSSHKEKHEWCAEWTQNLLSWLPSEKLKWSLQEADVNINLKKSCWANWEVVADKVSFYFLL